MKRYEWNYDGDIETFFARLNAAVIQKYDYFHLDKKSSNRFILNYQSPFKRSLWQIFLFGRAEQTPSGVTVKANLRMLQFARITSVVLISLSIWSFFMINTGFIGYVGASLFLLFNIFMLKWSWGISNTKGVIELMDNLQDMILPEPEPEQKEKREPRKTLTREEMFYRTPNRYTVPTKMYTTPDNPPVTNKSDAGGKSSK